MNPDRSWLAAQSAALRDRDERREQARRQSRASQPRRRDHLKGRRP